MNKDVRELKEELEDDLHKMIVDRISEYKEESGYLVSKVTVIIIGHRIIGQEESDYEIVGVECEIE